MARRKKPTLYVPKWLVEQFKITGEDAAPGEIPKGLKYDRNLILPVGHTTTASGRNVIVDFEMASGQSNWWHTINVFDAETGEPIAQSEPGFDLIGRQELVLEDGTKISFEVRTRKRR